MMISGQVKVQHPFRQDAAAGAARLTESRERRIGPGWKKLANPSFPDGLIFPEAWLVENLSADWNSGNPSRPFAISRR